MLRATTSPADEARAVRLVLAWLAGDRLALDVVMTEAMNEPTGPPALLFAMADLTASVGRQTVPHYAELLQGLLAETYGAVYSGDDDQDQA